MKKIKQIDFSQAIYVGDTDEEKEITKIIKGYKLELTEDELKTINLPIKDKYNKEESFNILGLHCFKQSVQIMFLKNFSVIDYDFDIIKIKDTYYFGSNVFLEKSKELYFSLLITNDNRYVFILNDIMYVSDIVLRIINENSVEWLINDLKTIISKPKKAIVVKTYLMINKDGHVKIGKSENPKIRERTLQSEQPSIKLYAIADSNIEKILHKKYNMFRVRGEWFKLSDNDILDIINEYGFKKLLDKN